MPELPEVAIEVALLERATAFAAAQSLPLAVPNVAFTPPNAKTGNAYGKWLKASLLPAPSFGLGIDDGSDNQHYGLLQIDVFIGSGAGEIVPKRIASAAAIAFRRGSVFGKDGYRIEISDAPRIGPSLIDDAWWQIPVTVPYRCFAPNQ